MDKPQQSVDDSESYNDVTLAIESAGGDETAATVTLDPAHESRRKRIFDLRAEAQDKPDAISACLAGVNSDLLDCELIVAESLRQELAASGNTIEKMERCRPMLDLLLRFSKHIAQVAQVEQKARKQSSVGETA